MYPVPRVIPDDVIDEITTLVSAAFLLGDRGKVALGYEVLQAALVQQEQPGDPWAPLVARHLRDTLTRYAAAYPPCGIKR